MGTTTNTTNKVGFAALNSANVKLNNSQDEARKYDVAANANIQGTEITSMDSGSVTTKDGMQVATFNTTGMPGGYNINTYNSVGDEERGDVLAAINSFITGAKAYASSNAICASN